VSAPEAIGNRVSAKPPGTAGVTLFASGLVLSPLLQWLYLTVLSHFTLLEPPFTHSSGLALAMQLFFSPGNIVAVVLGVGLVRRSERTRRIAQFVFLLTLGLAALQVGTQLVTWRFNSNALLAGTALIIAAAYFWFFGRPHVRQQFETRPLSTSRQEVAACATEAAREKARRPRALIACACMEILLCLAAAALTAHLWTVFSDEALLDEDVVSPMPDEQELLKMFMFASFAVLLSPHLLAAVASVGILLGRATTSMARRYSVVACWAVIGCLLLTAWLMSRPELSFDVRNALMLGAFCSFSLVWHLCFLYVLARSRSPSDAAAAVGARTR
jgi:hypothetical protein